jgi:hypothetical protein
MIIPLGHPLPDASRDLPGRQPENAWRSDAVPPLFDLAPGGVCHAVAVTGDAVRSYRTLSPLPPSAEALGVAVCSLWHFP